MSLCLYIVHHILKPFNTEVIVNDFISLCVSVGQKQFKAALQH